MEAEHSFARKTITKVIFKIIFYNDSLRKYLGSVLDQINPLMSKIRPMTNLWLWSEIEAPGDRAIFDLNSLINQIYSPDYQYFYRTIKLNKPDLST